MSSSSSLFTYKAVEVIFRSIYFYFHLQTYRTVHIPTICPHSPSPLYLFHHKFTLHLFSFELIRQAESLGDAVAELLETLEVQHQVEAVRVRVVQPRRSGGLQGEGQPHRRLHGDTH